MAPATNMQRYCKFNMCYVYLTTAHACCVLSTGYSEPKRGKVRAEDGSGGEPSPGDWGVSPWGRGPSWTEAW